MCAHEHPLFLLSSSLVLALILRPLLPLLCPLSLPSSLPAAIVFTRPCVHLPFLCSSTGSKQQGKHLQTVSGKNTRSARHTLQRKANSHSTQPRAGHALFHAVCVSVCANISRCVCVFTPCSLPDRFCSLYMFISHSHTHLQHTAVEQERACTLKRCEVRGDRVSVQRVARALEEIQREQDNKCVLRLSRLTHSPHASVAHMPSWPAYTDCRPVTELGQ